MKTARRKLYEKIKNIKKNNIPRELRIKFASKYNV